MGKGESHKKAVWESEDICIFLMKCLTLALCGQQGGPCQVFPAHLLGPAGLWRLLNSMDSQKPTTSGSLQRFANIRNLPEASSTWPGQSSLGARIVKNGMRRAALHGLEIRETAPYYCWFVRQATQRRASLMAWWTWPDHSQAIQRT